MARQTEKFIFTYFTSRVRASRLVLEIAFPAFVCLYVCACCRLALKTVVLQIICGFNGMLLTELPLLKCSLLSGFLAVSELSGIIVYEPLPWSIIFQ